MEEQSNKGEAMWLLSLEGEWGFALDSNDIGISEEWYSGELSGKVQLPGSLDVQGFGELVQLETEWTGTIFDRSYYEDERYAPYREAGNIKLPFWLQPDTRYVGPAWYQREIEVPEDWAGKRVLLFLERVHWQTHVWLNDAQVGIGESLSAGHTFELGKLDTQDSYRLTIRVDNRALVDVGENAHSISDHTQGNWNGIIGRIELLMTPDESWIDRVEIHPRVEDLSIRVTGQIKGNRLDREVALQVRKRGEVVSRFSVGMQAVRPDADGRFEARMELGSDARLWDEFDPVLYELEVRCGEDCRAEVFGLREFSTKGTQFCINGKNTFLRGALDCCIFPLTGHPPMDVADWIQVLGTIKAHGFNHIRFHSWCPPEAAFQAGDELGLYFQVECAVWPNSEAVLAFNSPEGIGDGKEVDQWVYREAERILEAYGNHACFVMMACGNEPGGPHHESFLRDWVIHFRARDGRRLYVGAAGWPELEENDFQVISEPRIHQWGDGLACRLNGSPPATVHDYRDSVAKRTKPIVAHENGQWTAYPPVNDVEKYTGHLKAKNFEIFADGLRSNGLLDRVADFVQASGKLQALCYKEEIESALRTPGFGGFQLLGLQDFPGQGTAPVGILDAFWEKKGYLSAEAMTRFCSGIVVLARLRKRVFRTSETFEADIEIAHYGPSELAEWSVQWSLIDDAGAVFAKGAFSDLVVESGGLAFVGKLSCSLKASDCPARYKLVVEAACGNRRISNDWDVWIYADTLEDLRDDLPSIVSNIQDAFVALENGRNVLLLIGRGDAAHDVELGFTTVFWNTACTQRQAPHTMGILCDPEHHALRQFPTDFHTNWQWWYLLRGACPVKLDGLPQTTSPIVQVIDDWFTNRHLGLLWEAKVGSGRLMVSGIDLLDASGCVVKRQFLDSILRYMTSDAFQPASRFSQEELESIFKD